MLDLLGEGDAPLPFVSERGVELGPNHDVEGNQIRFQTGVVELRPDREWVDRIAPSDEAVTTALKFPSWSGTGTRRALCRRRNAKRCRDS